MSSGNENQQGTGRREELICWFVEPRNGREGYPQWYKDRKRSEASGDKWFSTFNDWEGRGVKVHADSVYSPGCEQNNKDKKSEFDEAIWEGARRLHAHKVQHEHLWIGKNRKENGNSGWRVWKIVEESFQLRRRTVENGEKDGQASWEGTWNPFDGRNRQKTSKRHIPRCTKGQLWVAGDVESKGTRKTKEWWNSKEEINTLGKWICTPIRNRDKGQGRRGILQQVDSTGNFHKEA